MTIIEPHRNTHFTQSMLYFGMLIFLAAVSSIYFYNLNVNLKYQISLQEKTLQQLETETAEYRNLLYQILDSRNLSNFIKKQNLISDKNPDYFELKTLANL